MLANTIDVGERKYEVVPGWGDLPEGWQWGMVAAVAVDSKDRVHAFVRTEHPYMVFDRDGKLLYSWGKGVFGDAHGMAIFPDEDDNVFFVDRMSHQVLKFTIDGRHILSLGTRGQPSDTGWTDENKTVLRTAGPFNYPTNACILPRTGEILVSDGYRNACVQRFSPDGVWLSSWGEPGSGPGQFNLVHDVWEHRDKVYVCDRMNHRIQIFDPEGNYLDEWHGFKEPGKVYVDEDDVMYVAEIRGGVRILDLKGNLLGEWGRGERSSEAGQFIQPHGIGLDSQGDIYVAEVMKGSRLQKFVRRK